RRHTRWPRDWSSDVCSSDLTKTLALAVDEQHHHPYAVRVGQEVDQSHHVPNTGLHESHRLSPIPYGPKPKDFLAYGLPGPERFAGPEIAEDDDEGSDDRDQVRGGVHARRTNGERGKIQTRQ